MSTLGVLEAVERLSRGRVHNTKKAKDHAWTIFALATTRDTETTTHDWQSAKATPEYRAYVVARDEYEQALTQSVYSRISLARFSEANPD